MKTRYQRFNIFFLLLIITLSCETGKKKVSSDTDFGDYISAYTSGSISKASLIKVRLTGQFAAQTGKKDLKGLDLFDFSPEITGSVQWADQQTIEFIPDNQLETDTKYTATLNLDEFTDVPKEFREFNFVFKTIKQNFDVTINEVKTIGDKAQYQNIRGEILMADVSDVEIVKQIINPDFAGEFPETEWSSSPDGLVHVFTIDSLPRKNQAYTININWDGKQLGIEKKGKKSVTIPPVGEFKYISSKVIQQPEQYLQLQFTDPINPNQDLKGLVNIENVPNTRIITENNLVRVYPQTRLEGTYNVFIFEGIENVAGKKLNQENTINVTFEKLKPAVRWTGKGAILPSSVQGLILPFEAVNLKAVDIEITKIFDDNIRQFLQVNQFEGSYQLHRVGKSMLKKTVSLEESGVVDFGQWNRFTLDLNDLIKTDPGAIYRISVGFRKKYSLYDCGQTPSDEEMSDMDDEQFSDETDYDYGYRYYGEDYWQNRDNPCHRAYYGGRRSVSRNIFASNLGLIAKKGNDNSLHVFVTDIRTTEPLSGIEISVFDFQQQPLTSVTTNEEGKAVFEDMEDAFFIEAKRGSEHGIVKIDDGQSLSLSQFDVAGKAVGKGLKGYMYGERGVWRPGDSIYLTFVLKEEGNPLPQGHPILLELRNPNNQLSDRKVKKKNETGFYTFRLKTAPDAPTGNWTANIRLGGQSFNKQLKIETVKPNRLKIKLDFQSDEIVANRKQTATLESYWLHGAVAKNLKTKVDLVYHETKTSFDDFEKYHFDDISKPFHDEMTTIFEKKTNDQGISHIPIDFKTNRNAPGKLQANFLVKVFEQGGNFSINQVSKTFHPYTSYVGVHVPEGNNYRGMLTTDTTHKANLVIVDYEGKPVMQNRTIEMKLYKLSWRWWWDRYKGDLANYAGRTYKKPYRSGRVIANNGSASWSFRINYPDYGRFLLKAYDPVSGHSTAKVIYVNWPWYQRRKQDKGGVTRLELAADKEQYSPGEQIKLKVPAGNKGKVLLSIENGTKVLQTSWHDISPEKTEISVPVTSEMTPNVYLFATYIQPHAQTVNDLPVRLYGVIPVMVEDPATRLHPVIDMPDELESEKSFEMTVSEQDGKPMTYTIAVVDEGLLDLTNFPTPNAWDDFFAREALGVKSWDIYDHVIGAWGGELEKLLAIGGGAPGETKKSRKAIRFKPVVRFLGPFTLDKGNHTHRINMPRYVGSVRTMVVAGNGKAYGSNDKTTPVKKPLMLLATLPRVLGPGEKVRLPVTLFAMKDDIKNVKVSVETNDILKISGDHKQKVHVNEPGEQFIEFDIETDTVIGLAEVQIKAESGRYKALYDIELDVRAPNPQVTKIIENVVEAGESWETSFSPIGIRGTNSAVLEVASIPPVNLEKRLKFLIRYPHGCIEQTTSAAFPQLYLDNLTEIDKEFSSDIERNINHAIDRLRRFQLAGGGFGYWPNSMNVSEWGTNYAGHFLIEADKKGYYVPQRLINNWKNYQVSKARKWINDGSYSQLGQAYRLYTLALAGRTEQGAMNRLRSVANLSNAARWRLAAAYLLSGKERAAEKLISEATYDVSEYSSPGMSYGSGLRDKAMILEVLNLQGKTKEAFSLLKEISESLSSNRWYSTQTTAWSLIAVSGFAEKNMDTKEMTYTYTFNNDQENISTGKPISQPELNLSEKGKQVLQFENRGQGILYARVILQGKPQTGDMEDKEQNLKMDVRYKMLDGTTINPAEIEQGTDFYSEVTIKHPGLYSRYENVALTQIFPSGWEIINTRMVETGSSYNISKPVYQDVRDDRVMTYFDLSKGATKTFRIYLNASYAGTYYLPLVYAEEMYEASVNAKKHGQWVKIVRPGE
jgi:alpha-2-macroglobulin